MRIREAKARQNEVREGEGKIALIIYIKHQRNGSFGVIVNWEAIIVQHERPWCGSIMDMGLEGMGGGERERERDAYLHQDTVAPSHHHS